MFNCSVCGSQMKPLLTGFYCLRSCDRPDTNKSCGNTVEGFAYGEFLISVRHPATLRLWDVYLVTDNSIHGNWMSWWADKSAKPTHPYIASNCISDYLIGDVKSFKPGEVARWFNTYNYKLWVFIPVEKVDIDAVAKEFV